MNDVNIDQQNCQLLNWVNHNIQGELSNLLLLTNRVRSLPALSEWIPESNKISVLRILCLGVVLGRVSNSTFKPLLESIATSLRNEECLRKDDFAELKAASLIRLWCDDIEYIPRGNNQRTPDLNATLNGYKFEIEVTTAEEKYEQAARRNTISLLEQKIVDLPLKGHLSAYILDSPNEVEQAEIIREASELSIAGDTVELKDRWHLQLSAPRTSGEFVAEFNPPSWWPNQHATPASLKSRCTFEAGRYTTNASIEVRWGLSTKSYINPIKKKAERPQGTGSLPFLIAMDANSLPGAIKWYEENLPSYWEQWQHVSGVLIFNTGIGGLESLLWNYKLFPNPLCEINLPEALLQRCTGKEFREFF
jgi:hypothetical protein